MNRKYLSSHRLLVSNDEGDQVFNIESEAFQVQSRILEDFYNAVLKAGAIPKILIFPSHDDIARVRNGRSMTYSPLVEFLDARGLSYIDAAEAFADLPAGYDLSSLRLPGGHYSSEGNRLVAERVGAELYPEAHNSVKSADPRR